MFSVQAEGFKGCPAYLLVSLWARSGLDHIPFTVSFLIAIPFISYGGPLIVGNLGFLPLSTVTPLFLPLLTVRPLFLPLLTVTPAWMEGLVGSSRVAVIGSLHGLGMMSLCRAKRSPWPL